MAQMNWRGRCWHCGHDMESADYQRENRCPQCAKATHSCRNCRFYRPGIANDCREPVAERQYDKESANFCDYFEPWGEAFRDSTGGSADDLLKAAEDLFK